MLMFIVSNLVGSSIQITTLPLPVLSTLQASGLVFNTLFATLILGEPFTRYSFSGTVLVCVGAALIALFGALPEPAHNLDQLLELLGRTQFILWIAGTLLIVIATVIGARFLKYLANKPVQKPNPTTITRLRLMRGTCYGFISGILSAHTLLVAKSAVELIVRTVIDRVNQFNRFESWLIVLALIVLALLQLYYLHRGLKLCSTSILYPFVFCIYNIIAILDGLIYFHQTSLLSPLSAGLIAVGTVILLSGVLALSWRLGEEDVTETLPPPHTPLTPGLGLVDDRPRSSSNLSLPRYSPEDESRRRPHRLSISERSPLLSHAHPRRQPRLTSVFAPVEAERAEIWASLADEPSPNEDEDFLASLPRSPILSPYLTHHRRRSRSSTLSNPSLVKVNTGGTSSGEEELPSPRLRAKQPRRSVTWSNRQYTREKRRRSAPFVLSPDPEQGPGERSGLLGGGPDTHPDRDRPRSATGIRRWSQWWKGTGKEDEGEGDRRGGDG
jgi:magnesium transporter